MIEWYSNRRKKSFTRSLRRGVVVGHEAEEVDVVDQVVEVIGVEEALLVLVIDRRRNHQDEQLVRLPNLPRNRLDLK